MLNTLKVAATKDMRVTMKKISFFFERKGERVSIIKIIPVMTNGMVFKVVIKLSKVREAKNGRVCSIYVPTLSL